MLRAAWLVIYFFAYLIYLIPTISRLRKVEKEGDAQKINAMLHQIAFVWGKNIIRQTGSKVHVSGTKNLPEGPVLFVSNHQGYFDIPLLFGYIDKPKGFIAKKELAKVPLFGKWIPRMKSVFIDRGNPRQALRAFQQASKIMKTGYSMVIFPEGARSKGPHLLPFKPASLRLATQSGVPIVPIAIDGSYRIWEANKYAVKPSEIFIHVFEPIDPKQLSKEEQDNLADRIHNQIKSFLEDKNRSAFGE